MRCSLSKPLEHGRKKDKVMNTGTGRQWKGRAMTSIDDMSIPDIEAILGSVAHYAATQTRNYGERDPIDRPSELLFRCTCGGKVDVKYEIPPAEAMRLLSRPLNTADGRAFFVKCGGCGRLGAPSLREWRAVVDWNYMSASSRNGSFDGFPFFNLVGMSTEDGVARLKTIKYDLALRRAHAKKRKASGIDVGGRFLAKIDAYLGWAHVGLRVAEGAGPRKGEMRS